MNKQLFIVTLFLIGCCFFIFSSNLSAAESKELHVGVGRTMVTYTSDIVYKQNFGFMDHDVLKMDLMEPMTMTDEKRPVIVFLTGGGFISANKTNWLQQRMDLAEQGYVVASVEYRVTPEVTFPEPLKDVKSAIRYLKANANELNIDPDRIGVLGESAGGYLAAFLGTTSGMEKFEEGDNLEYDSSVKAVVDVYGLSDLTEIGADFSEEVQWRYESPGSTEALWVTGTPTFGGEKGGVQDNEEKAAEANPINYIADNVEQIPPFLLFHGEEDDLVSPSQTEIVHKELVKYEIDSERYVVKGAGHAGPPYVQPEFMEKIINYFDTHLK